MDNLPLVLVIAKHRTVPSAGVYVIWICGIGHDVAKLKSPGRRPIAIGDLSIIAAAGDGRRATVLLRSVNGVRKMLISADVIKLPGRLVVPRAPGFAAIHADGCALIDSENHILRARRI